jgi:hypothetical protein
MTTPLDKLARLELAMSRENGAFELFGIFVREDSLEKWDLVLAAPWLNPDERESLQFIVDQLQRSLTPSEMLDASLIVILEEGNPFLETVVTLVQVEHGMTEIGDFGILGVSIQKAYIITSMRRPGRKPRRQRKNTAAK